jgi:predicted DNA-binding protein YlxM (UPF0122 family)
MSHDPVTKSMLGEDVQHGTPKSDQQTLDDLRAVPNDPDTTPKINVTNLSEYSNDALRQVALDFRIKESAINNEIKKIHDSILAFKIEVQHLMSRRTFYSDIRDLISDYLKENEECRKHSPDTQPSQNWQRYYWSISTR